MVTSRYMSFNKRQEKRQRRKGTKKRDYKEKTQNTIK
jgi:hypothetical protein